MQFFKKIFFCLLIIANLNTLSDISKKKEYEDISILVPSCDKYSELWEPFTHFLFKAWPSLLDEHSYVSVYLMSNFEKFSHPRITNLVIGEDKSWSDNMLKALESVKTKYVVILLEDYILTQPVDVKRLANIMYIMQKNNGAYAELALDPCLFEGEEVYQHGLRYRSKLGRCRTSLQSCVFDVEVLKSLLKPGESAWDFEIEGSIRSQNINQPFYIVDSNPVFVYRNAVKLQHYMQKEVDYINKEGIKFFPKKMQILVEDNGESKIKLLGKRFANLFKFIYYKISSWFSF